MKINYQSSGVDINIGDKASNDAFQQLQKTFNSNTFLQNNIVGLKVNFKKFKNPHLALATDGVGTKLKYAIASGKHDTIGIDLVAMVVNDLVRNNIYPLGFALYRASGKLDLAVMDQVVKGIVKGCQVADCVYTTGETAEMPGFYQTGDYDLAGFAVGVFDKSKLITGEKIKDKDVIFAFPSSGFHSNGFSLLRKIYPPEKIKTNTILVREILTPTKIYVQQVLELNERFKIHGWAHITGSGLVGKLGKIIPNHLAAEINFGSWPLPKIYSEIEKNYQLSFKDLVSTFNLGLGMVGVASPIEFQKIATFLESKKEKYFTIGKIVARKKEKVFFIN